MHVNVSTCVIRKRVAKIEGGFSKGTEQPRFQSPGLKIGIRIAVIGQSGRSEFMYFLWKGARYERRKTAPRYTLRPGEPSRPRSRKSPHPFDLDFHFVDTHRRPGLVSGMDCTCPDDWSSGTALVHANCVVSRCSDRLIRPEELQREIQEEIQTGTLRLAC